jgi:hypothetical protein
MGHSYTDWTKAVGQFYLGDPSNPLIAGLGGDCGQLRNGVFMMVGPIDVGVEFDCDVPAGTWIVLSHAGFFATKDVDGQTDAEIEAVAANGFNTSIDKAMELGYNHPMGPLKLTDVVGLDVRLAIADTLQKELGGEQYRAPQLLRDMVKRGELGKKSGKGFYDWKQG